MTAPDGATHRFEVDAFARQMLLTGRDEIELTLGYEAQIREYEEHRGPRYGPPYPPDARSVAAKP